MQLDRFAVHRSAIVFFVLAALFSAARARAQLAPEAELATLQAAEGLEVSLFAAEPLITNPAAIDVDTQGRVWVAEIQWYRGGAKTPGADKIKVLQDTDGDGRADKVTVFADDLFAPMSICVAGPRVYVATSPDLWVYEDLNGDLVADGPPKRLLSGFGGHNHDHGAHSLVLGPDHKWWMSHGDQGFDVKGSDGSHLAYQWGGVLRGELDGSQLELVAANFRNPYEVCVSSFGEPFLSDNDNDGNESVRICWIMEGGNYGWFGGPPFGKQDVAARLSPDLPFREHWHFRGYIPGFVPATLVTGFGSPTGLCFYEGDAFGAKFKNATLHTDAGPRVCRVYRHEPAGFGMRASSEVFLSNSGDNYFRPDDIVAAPDGRLYVSDWYDGGVGGHGYNNPDQGRIFQLLPAGKKLARRETPGPYNTIPDAIEGLKSPNLATQYLARERLLAEGDRSVPALEALLNDAEPNYRARALWVFDRLGGAAREQVIAQLGSDDAAMRALAVRILRRHGEQYGSAILKAAGDPSAEVRREVLLAIRKLPRDQAQPALVQIAAAYDGGDRYLLEAINIAAGDHKAELLKQLEERGPLGIERFPLVQVLDPGRATEQLLARLADASQDENAARMALDGAANIPDVQAGWALLRLIQDQHAPAALRARALDKLLANVNHRGNWAAMTDDERFVPALRGLLQDADLLPKLLRAVAVLRIDALAADVLELARASNTPPQLRAQAIGVAARLRSPGVVDVLAGLLTDCNADVARAARQGMVEVQDVRALREVFSGDKLPSETRLAIANGLMDTPAGAVVLLRLIDEKQLPRDLQERAIAKARRHADSNVRVLYEKYIPESERPKRLGSGISADEILSLAGDANRGRLIFDKSSAAQCKQCHAVSGFGGSLGPELTNIAKKYERKALLETIIEPSKAIAPEFIPYVLETGAGQVYAGFVVERTADHVLLKDVKSRLVRVKTDDIEALIPQQKSLMPELVLSEVTAQDAADLLAYLMTLK